jgi:DNA-binding CsgD family transcriptional regulator
MRIYREWVRPQNLCDFISQIVLREPGRLGVFGTGRHDDMGPMTDDEIDIMRLLGPHIRRAVTIGDVLDLKKIEAQALAATVDKFAAGVAVVAEGNRILHANRAARGMFAAGGPVRSVHGRLSVADPRARRELDEAVALAQRNEAAIGAAGIGVALSSNGGEAAVAHVLPLARGDVRSRLMPQATAAVFVTQARQTGPNDISAVASSFGLTRTEARMLEHLAMGATLTEAAVMLEIANTTAKTHLAHIFSKTGVSRQADLIALINRLAPPVSRPMRE